MLLYAFWLASPAQNFCQLVTSSHYDYGFQGMLLLATEPCPVRSDRFVSFRGRYEVLAQPRNTSSVAWRFQ
jgi:hypothetical protein